MAKRQNTILQVLQSSVKQNHLKNRLQILKELTCTINKGEKVALLGRNGCGKTTFLRIIGGIYKETSGKIEVQGTISMLLKSSYGLNGHIPVVDNIYLLGSIQNIERSVIDNKIEEILTSAGLSDLRFTILKRLSSGEIQRLVLSTFFHADGDLLIFDESLESIDPDFVKECDTYFTHLASSNKTLIMTSHHGNFLKKYCAQALWLEDGKIKMQGEFDKVYSEYEKSAPLKASYSTPPESISPYK